MFVRREQAGAIGAVALARQGREGRAAGRCGDAAAAVLGGEALHAVGALKMRCARGQSGWGRSRLAYLRWRYG